jgi:hypothetical protein
MSLESSRMTFTHMSFFELRMSSHDSPVSTECMHTEMDAPASAVNGQQCRAKRRASQGDEGLCFMHFVGVGVQDSGPGLRVQRATLSILISQGPCGRTSCEAPEYLITQESPLPLSTGRRDGGWDLKKVGTSEGGRRCPVSSIAFRRSGIWQDNVWRIVSGGRCQTWHLCHDGGSVSMTLAPHTI